MPALNTQYQGYSLYKKNFCKHGSKLFSFKVASTEMAKEKKQQKNLYRIISPEGVFIPLKKK